MEHRSQLPTLASAHALIQKIAPQLQAAATSQIDVKRFARVALTAISRNPLLLQCDARSLAGALICCAQLGLEPDDVRGLAYLVPFWNSQRKQYEVTLIPGYRGLIMLALRSEKLSDFDAKKVHERDKFRYWIDDDGEHVAHEPYFGKEGAGELVAAYARVRFVDGHWRYYVMLREELDKVKAHALANKKNMSASPWNTAEEEMMLKTPIRRVSKTLPQAEALSMATGLDEVQDLGQTQSLELLAPSGVEAGPVSGEPGEPPADEAKPVRKAKETKPENPKPSDRGAIRGDAPAVDSRKGMPEPDEAGAGQSASAPTGTAGRPEGKSAGEGGSERSASATSVDIDALVNQMLAVDRAWGKGAAMTMLKTYTRSDRPSLRALSEPEASIFFRQCEEKLSEAARLAASEPSADPKQEKLL